VRAAGYGQDVSLPDYIKQANDQTLVVIHIETANAVEQIDTFVNIDSVDVIFIGPTDLSHSLGYPGQPDHPVVQKAIDRVIDAVKGTDLALGVYTVSASQARDWKQRGVRYIATGIEGLLKTSSRDFLETVRRE
jgi:4-hydroxy-2-oxoheptanedioate aldolase